jgi:uncharacterized protein (TIGR03118 family)
MNSIRSSAAAAAAAILSLAGCGMAGADPAAGAAGMSLGGAASDASHSRGDLGGTYVRHDLVSDGAVAADHVDPNLVNAWGIARSATIPWWVANNETATSTLYDGAGVPQALVVTVTGAGGAPAAPTGMVANPGTGFVVSSGGASGAARFIFASEDGTLSAWNPNVPPPVPPATRSTVTVVVVDRSSAGAIYKGLAAASTSAGDRLYAADFHDGRVDVFDGSFAPVTVPGAFVDPGIPAGFAPFGIQALNGTIYVTYAKQDAERSDEIAGRHLGYVSAFSTDGAFLGRIASGGKLNAPWGLALAPETGFGRASGKLLVGNFGDGRIVTYRLSGEMGGGDESERGGAYLTGSDGPVTIDGLWGIGFGNGAAAGPANALFFAAGPDDEAHGLFGRIDFVPGDDGQDGG